jgi:hypothetical protein
MSARSANPACLGRSIAAELAAFTGASIFAVGAFLFARLLLGAMKTSATSAQLGLVGLVLGGTVATILYLTPRHPPNWMITGASHALVLAGCALIALTTSARSSSRAGTVFVWSMVALPPALAMIRLIHAKRVQAHDPFDQLPGANAIEPAPADRPEEPVSDLDQVLFDAPIDQLFIRRVCQNGDAIVEARIRGRFEKGERTKNLHLGFCPPLETIPEVTVEQIDGPHADVSIGQRLHAGVRIDLRLRETPQTDVSVVVDLFAKSP